MTDQSTTDQSTTAARKPYLALSFAPIIFSARGRTRSVFGSPIVTTKKAEEDPDEPFKIPPGNYFLTLEVLNDVPVLDNSHNCCYLNAKWHMEPGSPPFIVAQKKPVEIHVVQKLEENGIGDTKIFKPHPLGLFSLALGEIEVKRGSWSYMLVGDVHRCFWRKASEPDWQSDVLTYKKPSPNPEYKILVE
ncbi:uncharacterized protein BHQ10_008360 [Talaromyces amestolkiae]|uniref:Uncharacterized protein n=1 Tax=Talaromyces amestolkiae TaxID=1196081 RepID=A0A364L965_TALAM|nr:uncharacterized protein BHQ10_008360 [Talaromyces amestolkiae]RAO72348.1 hypothetical protein BHQ10_008360 [Talaromyces amestolkiae]